MAEQTDNDFRGKPDPKRQLALAASGKLRGASLKSQPCEAKPAKPKRGMNKWETLYASVLEGNQRAGLIVWYEFEPMRLRLADRSFYKPDFCVIGADGTVNFFEIKGFWREASRVRIKVAARLFPWARFVAVTKRDGGWHEEEFSGDEWRLECRTKMSKRGVE
jgi:hypothetical protein